MVSHLHFPSFSFLSIFQVQTSIIMEHLLLIVGGVALCQSLLCHTVSLLCSAESTVVSFLYWRFTFFVSYSQGGLGRDRDKEIIMEWWSGTSRHSC
jgi:hypothetical protein